LVHDTGKESQTDETEKKKKEEIKKLMIEPLTEEKQRKKIGEAE
jgi:hypothetical protein